MHPIASIITAARLTDSDELRALARVQVARALADAPRRRLESAAGILGTSKRNLLRWMAELEVPCPWPEGRPPGSDNGDVNCHSRPSTVTKIVTTKTSAKTSKRRNPGSRVVINGDEKRHPIKRVTRKQR
jgi:hypothetical protein